MNRRGFIGALAGALTLDPEKLLWVPGKKLISIPRPAPSLVYAHNFMAQSDWMMQNYHYHYDLLSLAYRLYPKSEVECIFVER